MTTADIRVPFLIFLLCLCLSLVLAEHSSYRHYSRHGYTDHSYQNQTLIDDDEKNPACQLAVRCPTVPTLSPYDRDMRNRRFTIDTLLAMHGPPGPPGISGPPGNPGPRGAVGPQGEVGKSKEPVPIVAFIASLQKMLTIDSNLTETIVFENAEINQGNGYNSTTGIFTASHRGIYKFSLTIMAQMDSTAIARIIQNRNKVLGMIRCDCRRRFSHVRTSVFAELNENDQVMVEALGDPNDPGQAAPRNNIYGYTYTHFSGVLLFLNPSI